MKLLRWGMAGACAYVVYRYSIGRKAKGEDILTSPERTLAELNADEGEPAAKDTPAAKKPVSKAKTATRASAKSKKS